MAINETVAGENKIAIIGVLTRHVDDSNFPTDKV